MNIWNEIQNEVKLRIEAEPSLEPYLIDLNMVQVKVQLQSLISLHFEFHSKYSYVFLLNNNKIIYSIYKPKPS